MTADTAIPPESSTSTTPSPNPLADPLVAALKAVLALMECGATSSSLASAFANAWSAVQSLEGSGPPGCGPLLRTAIYGHLAAEGLSLGHLSPGTSSGETLPFVSNETGGPAAEHPALEWNGSWVVVGRSKVQIGGGDGRQEGQLHRSGALLPPPGGREAWAQALRSLDRVLQAESSDDAQSGMLLQQAWRATMEPADDPTEATFRRATAPIRDLLRSWNVTNGPGWPLPQAGTSMLPENWQKTPAFHPTLACGHLIEVLIPGSPEEEEAGVLLVSAGPRPRTLSALQRRAETAPPEAGELLRGAAGSLERQVLNDPGNTLALARSLWRLLNGPLLGLLQPDESGDQKLSLEVLSASAREDGFELSPSTLRGSIETLRRDRVLVSLIAAEEDERTGLRILHRVGLTGSGLPEELGVAEVTLALRPPSDTLKALKQFLVRWRASDMRERELTPPLQRQLEAVLSSVRGLQHQRTGSSRPSEKSAKHIINQAIEFTDSLYASGVIRAGSPVYETLLQPLVRALASKGMETWPTGGHLAPDDRPGSWREEAADGPTGSIVDLQQRGFRPVGDDVWSTEPQFSIAVPSPNEERSLLVQLAQALARVEAHEAAERVGSSYRAAEDRLGRLLALHEATASLPSGRSHAEAQSLRERVEDQLLAEHAGRVRYRGVEGRLSLDPPRSADEPGEGTPVEVAQRRFSGTHTGGAVLQVLQRAVFFESDGQRSLVSGPARVVLSLGPAPRSLGFAVMAARGGANPGRARSAPLTRRLHELIARLRADAARNPEQLEQLGTLYGFGELLGLYSDAASNRLELLPKERASFMGELERFFASSGLRLYPDAWDFENLKIGQNNPLYAVSPDNDSEEASGTILRVEQWGLVTDRPASTARGDLDVRHGAVIGPAEVRVSQRPASVLGKALGSLLLEEQHHLGGDPDSMAAWASAQRLTLSLIEAGPSLDRNPETRFDDLAAVLGFLLREPVEDAQPKSRETLVQTLQEVGLELFPSGLENTSVIELLSDPGVTHEFLGEVTGTGTGAVVAGSSRVGVRFRQEGAEIRHCLVEARLAISGDQLPGGLLVPTRRFLQEVLPTPRPGDLPPWCQAAIGPLQIQVVQLCDEYTNLHPAELQARLEDILESLSIALHGLRSDPRAAHLRERYLAFANVAAALGLLEAITPPKQPEATSLSEAVPAKDDSQVGILIESGAPFRLHRMKETSGSEVAVPALRLPNGVFIPGHLGMTTSNWSAALQVLREDVLEPLAMVDVGHLSEVASRWTRRMDGPWWLQDPQQASDELMAAMTEDTPPRIREAILGVHGDLQPLIATDHAER